MNRHKHGSGGGILYRERGEARFCGGGTSSDLHLNTKRRDKNSITGKWKSPVVWQWQCGGGGLWLRDDTIKVLLYFAWWGRDAASRELPEGTLMSSACQTQWQEASLQPGDARKWMTEWMGGLLVHSSGPAMKLVKAVITDRERISIFPDTRWLDMLWYILCWWWALHCLWWIHIAFH